MELLERNDHLAELSTALARATIGEGSIVAVSGEAGAGKTSLIRVFVETATSAANVLRGACDDLANPRPLGPILDMLTSVTTGTASQSAAHDVYGAMLAALTGSRPTVVVIEDAQWADEATLDVLRFIGRRIEALPATLVLTYRTHDVQADHPLRVALGMVPAAVIRHLSLPALSIEAVSRLAGRREVSQLYEFTAGNPFLVQQMLAPHETAVPATVQDAVMARLTRLSPEARAGIDLVAAAPGQAERWLLNECGVTEKVLEAVRAGLLHSEGQALSFRHELVRQAIRHSMPTTRWRTVNAHLLDVLATHNADPTRLAHHAVEADRPDAIVRYAPLAARRAKDLGEHAEAFDYYGRVVDHAELLTTAHLVDMLEGYADAAQMVGRWDDARHATTRSIALCRQLSDRRRLGWNLCTFADVAWSTGHGRAAHEAILEAVSVLEAEPANAALSRAYALRAKFSMVDFRFDEGAAWGEQAINAASQAGVAMPVHALVTIGTCRMQADAALADPLVDALDVALRTGDLDNAARAYVNLAGISVLHLRYDQARRFIDEGVKFLESHDMHGALDYMLGVRGQWHLDRGHWAHVERDRRASPAVEAAGVVLTDLSLARAQARRGVDAAVNTLQEATMIAQRCGDTRVLVPAALAQAELAWLNGDLAGTATAITGVIDRIRDAAIPRWTGEASLWLHRAGQPAHRLDGAATPYALQIDGNWRAAAEEFTALGRPYDTADALADANDPDILLEALTSLDGMGGTARAAMVRRRLAEMDIPGIPRGPRRSTRTNPAGLTSRQAEVLVLMASDLTYRQIAERLHVSLKTVDHHATALRTKLNVHTRSAAVAAAHELGIVHRDEGQPDPAEL